MNQVNPRPVDVFVVVCGVMFFTAIVMFLANGLESLWVRYRMWREKKRWENWRW